MTLNVNNLHVSVNSTEIIHGITLEFQPGKIHALMGQNGSGKSTFAHAIMGNPKYTVTKGTITLDNNDITSAKPEIRAKAGLFLSFQHPPEIPGVSISTFLRQAVNAVQQKMYSVVEFHALLKDAMAKLKIDPSFSKRFVHEGLSGGEKKRLEVLQLLLLKPRYALLDETDSGLDVDAIKIVADGITLAREQSPQMSIVIITHYHRFLEFLRPDAVSVMSKGKIVAQGKYDLAQKIEKEGFEKVIA
ncbi:TPA: Fe-S cluster assembly ATPase SufC [Candidatus Woesearchaeota archaeon]|nr:Fe-S cluster assembly ATPase SufC [Candidatus Woesearchaeota archaeon]